MSKRKVSLDEATAFYTKLLLADANNEVDIDSAANSRKLRQVMEVYTSGQGQDTVSAKGTAWGLVNAVTRWADHERGTQNDDTRRESAWFGNGNAIKQDALESALQLAA